MEIGEPGGFLDWLTESLDAVVALSRSFQGETGAGRAPARYADAVFPVVDQLLDHEGAAFLTVGADGVEFEITDVHRIADPALIQGEVEHQISVGNFAWALYKPSPVVLPSVERDRWIVMHSVSTPGRVWGMFIARLAVASSFVPDVAQKLLTLAMAETAGHLETRKLRSTGMVADVDSEREVRWSELLKARTEALRKSELHARAAERGRDEFLAQVNHGLRTPLNGVVGMASLLLSSDLGPDQRAHAETIRQSGQRLIGIVDEIMDASRVAAGQLDLDASAFSLRQLVEEAVTSAMPLAGEEVDLVLRFGAAEPDSALGDPRRVGTVVRYVIRSAVVATVRGTVLVEVDEGPEGDFRVAVSDSGPPLNEREIGALLKDPEPGDVEGVSGALTPSLCRELVTLMGGRISIHSPSSGGLRVVLSLPLPRTPPQDAIPSPRTLSGRPVALVCDSPLVAGVAAEVISELGGRPMAYASIEEADALDLPEGSRRDRTDEMLVIIQSRPDLLPRPDARLWPGPRIAFLRGPASTGPSDASLLGFDALGIIPVTHRSLEEAFGRITESPSVPDVSSTVSQEDRAPRILLVEDDPVNQRVAESMLARLECEVVRADNGDDALRLVMSEAFDLVLMDCEVPGLNGFQAAQAIRAWEQPRGGRVPIVALTARASTEDRDHALRAGMDDFMAKPILIEDLEWMLGRWLPQRSAPEAPGLRPTTRPEAPSVRPAEAERNASDELRGHDEVVVFDWDGALSRMGGDPDVFEQVFTLFQAGWEEVQRSVPAALAQGDMAAVAAAAHRMKGSAGNLGAVRVGDLASRLERAARTGQEGDLGNLWLALDEAVERFVEDVVRRTAVDA